MSSFSFALLFFILGFISLAYEVLWFRFLSFTTGSDARTFGIFLSFFLAGIAAGSLFSEKYSRALKALWPSTNMPPLSYFFFLSSLVAFLILPALGWLSSLGIWQLTFIAIFFSTSLFGAAFPLLSHSSISLNNKTGWAFSLFYLSNILGCTLGSLLTNMLLTDIWSGQQITFFLLFIGFLQSWVLIIFQPRLNKRFLVFFVSVSAIFYGLIYYYLAPLGFQDLYAKLLYKKNYRESSPLSAILENRHGIIAVNQAGAVFGNGAYDGMFSIDLAHDPNMIKRVYFIGLLHPHPSDVLIVGLGSGSWTRVIINLPGVEKVTIVEINPGYQKIIRHKPDSADILDNKKVTLITDDIRRWLRRNPSQKFDLVVQNAPIHNHASATNLLSQEYLGFIKTHLKERGVFYYNTTFSQEALKTGILQFPYGLRFINCIAVSNSPITVDRNRWESLLKSFTIHGIPVLDLSIPEHQQKYTELAGIFDSLQSNPQPCGLETRESILERTNRLAIITDDNMFTEFSGKSPPEIHCE